MHNNQVKIWDISDEKQAKCIQTIEFNNYAVAIEAAGGCFFVGLATGVVEILDVKTGTSLGTIKNEGLITSLQVDGNRLIAGGYGYVISFGAGRHYDTIKIWDFGISSVSPYRSSQLEGNLQILGEMAALEHKQDYDGLVKLIETAEKELHPDFQRRIDECAANIVISPPGSSQKKITKEVILQVQAELCVEVMLHAINSQNWERVHQLLDQLQFIDSKHRINFCKLFELLWIESGRPDKWGFGENAFYDRDGYSASIGNKFQAALKFRELLKAKYPRAE